MSHTAIRITPQEFAPPPMIDRLRSRMLVVGVVFGVVLLALTLGLNKWDLFLRAWLFAGAPMAAYLWGQRSRSVQTCSERFG